MEKQKQPRAATPVDLRIDFGEATSPPKYNNVLGDETGAIILIDFATGNPTTIKLEIVSPFEGYFNNAVMGQEYPVDDLGIPQGAAEDGLYGSEATEPAIIKFSGLNPDESYDMLFFASRMGQDATDNLETEYEVIGQTTQKVLLDAANNTSKLAHIEPIQPNEDGEIRIEIRRGANNNTEYFWLSSMSLWGMGSVEEPPPDPGDGGEGGPEEPPIDRPLRPSEPPPSEWDYLVTNLNELKEALSEARSGQVIRIAQEAEINMTGKGTLSLDGGVTLCSNRTVDDSWGALIYTDDKGHYPLINVTGPGARISGLRIRGADMTTNQEELENAWNEGGDPAYEQYPYTCGITTHYSIELDNCELFGWTHAAIIISGGKDSIIRNNYFHHCQRWGLGYGVCMSGDGYALITKNYWDYNRHSIAGTGTYGQGYEASFNIVMQKAISHAFDMHSGEDRGDGTLMAGSIVNIHHNIFYVQNQKAFYTEGEPTDLFVISNNRFVHEDFDDAVYLKLGDDIVEAAGNTYGIDDRVIHPPFGTEIPPDREDP